MLYRLRLEALSRAKPGPHTFGSRARPGSGPGQGCEAGGLHRGNAKTWRSGFWRHEKSAVLTAVKVKPPYVFHLPVALITPCPHSPHFDTISRNMASILPLAPSAPLEMTNGSGPVQHLHVLGIAFISGQTT